MGPPTCASLFTVFLSVQEISGHGMMLSPLSRNAKDGINTIGGNMWFSHGCSIGCTQCNDTGIPVPHDFPHTDIRPPPGGFPNTGGYGGDLCPTDHSKDKIPTVNDPHLTSMNAENAKNGNWTRWHPWASPGSTPGFDPCGIAGGARTNMSYRAGGFGPQTGYPQGFPGSKLPPIARDLRATWKSGGIAEVSWASVANHAGGYSYALCPASSDLTEECFERTPITFANYTHQKLRYMFLRSDGSLSPNRTEVTIAAHRVLEGVHPPGSQWTKNPIPTGTQLVPSPKGAGDWNGLPPHGYQFPPPAGCDASCWGYQPCNVGFTHPSYHGWNNTAAKAPACANGTLGLGCCHTTAYMAIIDAVNVPAVPAGEYVVRWTWNAEQSPQIWSGCGDILIQ